MNVLTYEIYNVTISNHSLYTESSVAPPPGFGPQVTKGDSSTVTNGNSTYSLWGNGGSLQGLFRQQSSGLLITLFLVVM